MLKIETDNTTPFAGTAKKPTRTNAVACCSGRWMTTDPLVTSTARCGNTRTDSPQNRYHIDPKELVRIQREGRARREDIIGFYHSHPDHPAQWSPTDLAEAHWFGCSYVITRWPKAKRTDQLLRANGNRENDKSSWMRRSKWYDRWVPTKPMRPIPYFRNDRTDARVGSTQANPRAGLIRGSNQPAKRPGDPNFDQPMPTTPEGTDCFREFGRAMRNSGSII